jgi:hypothetical protein
MESSVRVGFTFKAPPKKEVAYEDSNLFSENLNSKKLVVGRRSREEEGSREG